MNECSIKGILFDFGGVIADEGFRNGLLEMAGRSGLDPEEFFRTAGELIHETGYLLGTGSEHDFWEALRLQAGVKGSDKELRETILKGFTLRPWMVEAVERLKGLGVRVAILSDQTNWLDELEEHLRVFGLFERVFNSYHLGKSKLDPTQFTDVLEIMGLKPGETLFVDDNAGHVERAEQKGLHAILFRGKDDFLQKISAYCPGA